MGCLKYMIGLIGLAMLIAGGALVFISLGPQLFGTQTRELGGASITQMQVASDAFSGTYDAANLPDLPVTVDGERLSTNSINAQPALESPALSDISNLDSTESDAAAELNTEQTTTITELQDFGALSAEDAQVASGSIMTNAALNADTEVEVVPLNIAPPAPSSPSGQGGASGVGRVEQRLVELEWPENFRVGGSGAVRLTLKALPDGQIEVVPEVEDNAVLATPILLTDRYDTHNAQFTARLVAPAFDVEATTPSTQTLTRGESGTWRWSLGSPDNSGRFVLTLGIDVVWTPKNPADTTIGPRPIWGQALQVDANYVFGEFTVPQASTVGGALAFAGFLSQIPLLGEIMGFFWRLLFGRHKPQKKQRNQGRR